MRTPPRSKTRSHLLLMAILLTTGLVTAAVAEQIDLNGYRFDVPRGWTASQNDTSWELKTGPGWTMTVDVVPGDPKQLSDEELRTFMNAVLDGLLDKSRMETPLLYLTRRGNWQVKGHPAVFTIEQGRGEWKGVEMQRIALPWNGDSLIFHALYPVAEFDHYNQVYADFILSTQPIRSVSPPPIRPRPTPPPRQETATTSRSSVPYQADHLGIQFYMPSGWERDDSLAPDEILWAENGIGAEGGAELRLSQLSRSTAYPDLSSAVTAICSNLNQVPGMQVQRQYGSTFGGLDSWIIELQEDTGNGEIKQHHYLLIKRPKTIALLRMSWPAEERRSITPILTNIHETLIPLP